MDLIASPSAPVARVAISRLASPVRWFVLGFASACIASPVLPWQADARSSAATTHAAPPSTLAEPQRGTAIPVQSEPYEPGGPGPSDNTEWMPGNR